MRAVNVIPREDRRGGTDSLANLPLGWVAVAGGFLVAVIVAALFVSSANNLSSRKSQLAQVRSDVDVAQVESAALKPYRDFAALRQARVQTVTQIAGSRLNWTRTLNGLSHALPADVGLTAINAKVNGDGASGNADPTMAAAPVIKLSGCTRDHQSVAQMMVQLRQVEGVLRVALATANRKDTAGTPGAKAATAAGDCPFPTSFAMTVSFRAPGAAGRTQAAPAEGAS